MHALGGDASPRRPQSRRVLTPTSKTRASWQAYLLSPFELPSALVRAGLEVEDLAAQVDVDAKTVQRWLGGRTPRARHRAKIADALQRDEHDLWPDVTEPSSPSDDRRELAGIYAHASDVRVPDWRTLLQDAREQVDLLDYTLNDIVGSPGVTNLLTQKADAGCRVRVLIAHPKSIWVTSLAQQLGQDQDVDGNTEIDRDISLSRGRLEPLVGHESVELRTFWAERTNSILRFDDQMLVTLHLYATPGPHAPVIHLRRHHDQGLFDRFANHLETISRDASDPIETDQALFPLPSGNPGRYETASDGPAT